MHSKEEMDIESDQMEQEEPEQLAEEDLNEDLEDEPIDSTKSFVKVRKTSPASASAQPIQHASQIDEESDLDKYSGAEDFQEPSDKDLTKSSVSLRKANKQLKKDLDKCKLDAGQRQEEVPKQP